MLSSNDPALAAGTRFQVVIDEKPGQGPLEGLRAALSICKSDSLVVTTCDTPLFSSTLVQLLMEACQGCSAVACMDRKGRLHPLCGVYRKACVPVIEAALSEGIFRVQEVFQQVGGIIFPLAGTEIPDETLYNVNTQEEFAAFADVDSRRCDMYRHFCTARSRPYQIGHAVCSHGSILPAGIYI